MCLTEFYWVLYKNHTTKLAGCCCCLLFALRLCAVPSLTHWVFLSLFFPVNLVVLSPPFLNLLRPLSFLFLSFSLSQSCRGSFTSTSTHTSSPTPTFMLSLLSVSPAWLCAAATIPGARRWGHTPRESCRPDQISTIPTGHETNSPAACLPQHATFFCLSYSLRHSSVQSCAFSFSQIDTITGNFGSYIYFPAFQLVFYCLFCPPRVRFLHPSHQSLCPQSDLKTADSCRSCVCGPFRKLYSPWNQARLDGFPASGDSQSAYQLFMSLKLGDDCRGYVWYVQVRKTDKHQCLKSGAHVFMLMWPWKQKMFTITEQQTDTQCNHLNSPRQLLTKQLSQTFPENESGIKGTNFIENKTLKKKASIWYVLWICGQCCISGCVRK